MLKTTSASSQPDGKQLLAALLSSLKLLLVALSLVVIVVSLFSKSLVGLGMVALQGLNLLLTAAIDFVGSSGDVGEFCAYLAGR